MPEHDREHVAPSVALRDPSIFWKRIYHFIDFLCGNFIFHLLLLLIVAWHCLPLHGYRMFNGLDGVRHLILARNEWQWWPLRPYLSFNILQGMANVFYGFNLNGMPVPLLQNLLRHGHVGVMASYLLYSIQYFCTAYLWTRLFCFTKQWSLAAAWLVTVCALPFLPVILLHPEFQTVPMWIDLLFFSTLLLYCCREIGRTHYFFTFGCLLGLIFIPYYIAITSLYFVLLVTPVIVLSSGYFLLMADSRSERISKIACYLIAAVSTVLLQVPQFLYSLISYSAYHFFTTEIFNPHTQLTDVSLLFQYSQNPVYAGWVILSVIGAVFALKSQHINMRRLAILHLLLVTTIITIGLWTIYRIRYGGQGSEGMYYEIILWPSYAAYSLYAIYKILYAIYKIFIDICNIGLRALYWLIQHSWPQGYFKKLKLYRLQIHIILSPFVKRPPWPLIKKITRLPASNGYLLLIPLLVFFGNHPETTSLSHIKGKPYQANTLYPPIQTPIISELQQAIALRQNVRFNGYAATLTPQPSSNQGISWFDQAAFDNYAHAQFGNDHRLVGLWYYDIPTLNEYSHLITPPLYLVETRLLSRPIDKPVRTGVAYTVARINVLKMLGVKFIITNQKVHAVDAQLSKKLYIDQERGYLYLYRLVNANVGHYSPTQMALAKTAMEILVLMHDPHFLFQQRVIVSQPLPTPLVPAIEPVMRVAKDGIRLTARSKGISTLLLPIQYSHCLQATFPMGRPHYFTLQRANLVDTLVTFSGSLHVKLSFLLGPLYDVNCRLQDRHDMDELKVKLVPKRLPTQGLI